MCHAPLYDGVLTIIDNSTLDVVRRVRLAGAPAGAFLIEAEKDGEPGICFVVTTSLPYE